MSSEIKGVPGLDRRGFLKTLLKRGIVGLAGTGVAGATAVNYIDNLNQKQAIVGIGGSMQNMAAQIRELNGRITLDQIVGVVSSVTPSTVKVGGSQGHGSGVIVITDTGRYILTNAHVTRDNSFEDGLYEITPYNGNDFNSPQVFKASPVNLGSGEIVDSPPSQNDFALLQIPPDVVLPAGAGVRIRDLEREPIRVGEPVIAVGNPFDLRDSVTFGIISHAGRRISLNASRNLQTDAAINPGNSGGGLFDMQGRLIAINDWTYRGGNTLGGSIRIDEIVRSLQNKRIGIRTQ